MLTEKQRGLFALLDIKPELEADMRHHHKVVKKIGAPQSFTVWLEKCLHAKWRRENSRTYLGD